MLGKTSMRILKHAVAVMRPRGGVFDLDVDDDVIASMAGFLEYLPAPARLSFPLGLRLLEYGPFLFREGFRTFSSMDEETAARYLHHWERAGSAPSLLYQGVRALVFVCFYQHPRILEAMEVDWQGRADERVKFRARVLRERILREAANASATPRVKAAETTSAGAGAPSDAPARHEQDVEAMVGPSPEDASVAAEEPVASGASPAPRRGRRKKAAVGEPAAAADDETTTPGGAS